MKLKFLVAFGAALAMGAGIANAEEETAISGEYKSEAGHRYITFSYDHQGYSRPQVRWRDWDAVLNWNAEDPSSSTVSVKIDVASVDTGVDVFDGHLKSVNWFDAEKFPEITFVSTAAEIVEGNTGKLTGDLTVKGVTKPVSLDVIFHKGGVDRRTNEYKLGFSGETTVKRSDFGLEAFVPFVGDDIAIVVSAEFVMPKK